MENKNLIEIEATIEVPSNIDLITFSRHYDEWIYSMGWSSCGIIRPYNDDEEEN